MPGLRGPRRACARAVEGDREVKLAIDRGGLLDQDLADLDASGGVCGVLSICRDLAAACLGGRGLSASLMPPALPAACVTCALTTTVRPAGARSARLRGVSATSPRHATPTRAAAPWPGTPWIFTRDRSQDQRHGSSSRRMGSSRQAEASRVRAPSSVASPFSPKITSPADPLLILKIARPFGGRSMCRSRDESSRA